MALKTAEGAANSKIPDGTISATQAWICRSCEGSGDLKYEYNYRAMTKICDSCGGQGLLNTKKQNEGKDGNCFEENTQKAGAPRVMTHAQRYFVQALSVVPA